ncbi:hypothetical protein [Kitasatospora sp. NPDC059599]|uniref:hypothetical protein n=1 Tax=Kitasatospora sp. NPDC059599 TaxID=3346880 RepID=UPI0036CD85ED
MPRLQEIHANVIDRLQEAKDQGSLGEVSAIETTLARRAKAGCRARPGSATVHLGMPDFRRDARRSSAESED